GTSFLGDNRAFYDRIPVEAIEKINVYNMKSEFSERTGKDDGQRDMVLDLKIKKSFLDKFYGDVTAAYQTLKNYEGNVEMNRLSKRDPFMLFVTANSLNNHYRRTVNSFTGTGGNSPGEEQYGSVGYQHKWTRREGKQWLRSDWAIGGGLAHDDEWENTRQDTESFLSNGTTNYRATSRYKNKHELGPHIQGNYRHAINAKNTVKFDAEFEYAEIRGHNDYHSANFDGIPKNVWSHHVTDYFDDTAAQEGLYLRQQVTSASTGHHMKLDATGSWTRYVKKGSLIAWAHVKYTDDLENWNKKQIDEKFSRYSYSQGWESQSSRTPESRLEAAVSARVNKWVRENVLLDVCYMFQRNSDHLERDYFRYDILSAGNSYDERYTRNDHQVRAASTINIAKLQLMPEIVMDAIQESDDYLRGELDTVAVRHALTWKPKLYAKWIVSASASLEMSYELKTEQPRLVETIRYRDDTNRYSVMVGNPDLREIHTNSLRMMCNLINNKRQRIMNFTLSYWCHDRDKVSAWIWDPQTYVNTVRPEMVRGSDGGNLAWNYDQGLGKEFWLRSKMNVKYGRYYGYLTRTSMDAPGILNRQHNLSLSENLNLSYDHRWLKCSLFSQVKMVKLNYSKETWNNETQWQEQIGANLKVEWKKLTVATNVTEYIRHGHRIESMNTHYMKWDASASLRIMNGKARLKLELDDILNQLDTYYVTSDATSNVYKLNEFRHHFVNLSFTYHLDAKQKKK
ncbi:MAG: outer membrane beta-barrel family protein, partial [Bacteroidaceae bacterium]|nr:outer membrane beta-barrel family protein [Bacteroidaceae bacterium]